MKDKKPRASYRRGRGVAMSPRGRSTVAPRPRRSGGRSPAPVMPVRGGMPQAPKVALKSKMNVGRPEAPVLPVRGGRPRGGSSATRSQAQQAAAGGGGRRPQRRDVVMPTRERVKAPKPALRPTMNTFKPQAPTLPVRGGRPQGPRATPKPVQSGRPQAPTLPAAGRRQSAAILDGSRFAKASNNPQKSFSGESLKSGSTTVMPRKPSGGNRKTFSKGGKAGYGSVQEMEQACMVKSDHNPSMRQK